jgi:multidrug transporter EmrE-like cation transporter
MSVLALVIIGLLLALSGDMVFKSGIHTWAGFTLYAASGVPVLFSYRFGTWMQVAVYWSNLAIVLSGVLGVLWFRETLGMRQVVSFALAIGSIVVWNWQ